jgi:hypothetical protein
MQALTQKETGMGHALVLAAFIMGTAVAGQPPAELRLDLPGLFPEGITHDPASGRFFVGSLKQNRIVQIDEAGTVSDFVGPCQHGLLMVLGMKVDPGRRVVWVCSAHDPEGPPCAAGASPETGLLKFSLEDGRLLGKWLVPQPNKDYLFNDVALTKAGDAYATTFAGAEIHKVDAATETMSLLAKMPGDVWNNGIALSPDEKTLFVGAGRGIYRVDLATNEITEIAPPDGERLGYVDGLYYFEGSLVAVQGWRVEGGGVTTRVARSWLNDDQTAVTRIEVLAQDEPGWMVPTTGVIVDRDLYLLATSYLDRIDTKGPDGAPPTHPEVLVRRISLEPR